MRAQRPMIRFWPIMRVWLIYRRTRHIRSALRVIVSPALPIRTRASCITRMKLAMRFKHCRVHIVRISICGVCEAVEL